jgi:Tol biopolymer transport system component
LRNRSSAQGAEISASHHRARFWLALSALTGLVAVAGALVLTQLRDDSARDSASAPRVVYLAPADALRRNLYAANLSTGERDQLTDSAVGIEDYAVSPDGARIAYTQLNLDGTSDIWLLEMVTGVSHPLTACVDALCSAPAWHPDGARIAYQRADFNPATDRAEYRAWVVDANTLETGLLLPDEPQWHGIEPQWDPTGQRVALFDDTLPGIRVRTLASGDNTLIQNFQETSGVFAPDGTRLVYPVITRGAIGQQFYTHLEMIDFELVERAPLSGPDDAPVDDGRAVWSADGARLLVARRYLDERFTAGKQLYLLDVASGSAEPVVVDAAYNHAAQQWSADERWIVFQRFALAEADAAPSVWVFDQQTGNLTQVAENALFPAWLPR